MKLHEISVPQLGANDSEVIVTEWKVTSGAKVSAGETIGTLETTKTVVDLVAEDPGYVYLLVEQGATVPMSSVVALIAPQESQTLVDEWVSSHLPQQSFGDDEFALAGVTLTKKALDFVRASGILRRSRFFGQSDKLRLTD
jgi:pyruvate/2-oxoglutarate dehydrogenase complex dihydrolipoamide acyltransferase (E2) component